jgi:hypothetical protein
MPARGVARIAWELPNGQESVLMMGEDDALVFGRASKCHIQFGRVPHDAHVPSAWGRLTWGRRIRVENIAERIARLPFTLYPVFQPGAAPDEGPCDVAPGMECSLSSSQFEIRAHVPAGLGIEYRVRINAFRPGRTLDVGPEDPSVFEIALSDAERRIGQALVAPLDEGRATPATYAECADVTHYSRDGVRDAVERIDSKLAGAGIYAHGLSGRTPERVARALVRHRHLMR